MFEDKNIQFLTQPAKNFLALLKKYSVAKTGGTMTGNLVMNGGIIRPHTVESTLTVNLTIAKGDGQIFNLNPNGANRDVTLWASPTVGDQIQIRNSGTGGFLLTVKNSAGTAITRGVVANNVTIVLTYYSAGWAV